MTKTEAIARFNQIYPDCDATLAGTLFDESHLEIMDVLSARTSTLAINLVAGTQEYALSATVVKVNEAYYQPSSTQASWIKLSPISLEQLAERGNWRAQNLNMIPTEYYIDTTVSGNTSTNIVGFVQIPPTTTSASYPNVTLYGKFVTALSGADALPVMITYTDIYPYLMAKKFCTIKQQDINEIMKWNKLFQEQCQLNQTSIKGMQFGNEGMFLRPQFINSTTRGR